jgi:2',3'-cyclic-nucleotide 2'-phosphodiesterase/3'-nucleotidase
VNSYRGSGGGGHLARGCGFSDEEIKERLKTSTDKDLRYYMIKWIEKKTEVDIKADNNWKLIPENDLEPLIEKEIISLFNSEF